jgi:hypothetical protein
MNPLTAAYLLAVVVTVVVIFIMLLKKSSHFGAVSGPKMGSNSVRLAVPIQLSDAETANALKSDAIFRNAFSKTTDVNANACPAYGAKLSPNNDSLEGNNLVWSIGKGNKTYACASTHSRLAVAQEVCTKEGFRYMGDKYAAQKCAPGYRKVGANCVVDTSMVRKPCFVTNESLDIQVLNSNNGFFYSPENKRVTRTKK